MLAIPSPWLLEGNDCLNSTRNSISHTEKNDELSIIKIENFFFKRTSFIKITIKRMKRLATH